MNALSSTKKKETALTVMLICFWINMIFFFTINSIQINDISAGVSKSIYGAMVLNILIGLCAAINFTKYRNAQ